MKQVDQNRWGFLSDFTKRITKPPRRLQRLERDFQELRPQAVQPLESTSGELAWCIGY